VGSRRRAEYSVGKKTRSSNLKGMGSNEQLWMEAAEADRQTDKMV